MLYMEQDSDGRAWVKLTTMTAGGIDDTLQELSLYVKHGILRLQETWREIGVNDSEQAEKCKSVVSSLRSVLDSLVIGERAWKECLEEECTGLSDKCNEAFKQLGLPTFDPRSVTLALLSKRDFLVDKNTELGEEMRMKKAQIDELEAHKIRCLQRLGLQPDHYPSIQSENLTRIISLLDIQIKEFEEDMGRRTKSLHKQLSSLAELMDALEINRCGLIEEGLVSDEPDTLLLSDESIQRRHDMIVKYKAELQSNTEEALDLKYKISRLHRLVQKDIPISTDISSKFGCPKPSSLALLNSALADLDTVKNTYLESYVAGLQDEIASFQKLCFQTKCEVSSACESVISESCEDRSSTDTLDLPDIILDDIENKNFNNGQQPSCHVPESIRIKRLEDDLETWESFYRSNRTIFEMVSKWKFLNDRYFELQTPSPDKYTNRGGSLLQSQKESAKIAKEIPRLELKVLNEVDKLNGEIIKINGLSVEDYFLEMRATTSLSRINSVRRSKRQSGKPSPGLEDTSLSKSRPLEVKSTSRRSMRKRISRDSLDKVGLK